MSLIKPKIKPKDSKSYPKPDVMDKEKTTMNDNNNNIIYHSPRILNITAKIISPPV